MMIPANDVTVLRHPRLDRVLQLLGGALKLDARREAVGVILIKERCRWSSYG